MCLKRVLPSNPATSIISNFMRTSLVYLFFHRISVFIWQVKTVHTCINVFRSEYVFIKGPFHQILPHELFQFLYNRLEFYLFFYHISDFCLVHIRRRISHTYVIYVREKGHLLKSRRIPVFYIPPLLPP